MSLVATSLLIGLTGCGALNSPKPTQNIPLSQSATVEQVYTFNDQIDSSPVDQSAILKVITNTMSENSSYKNKNLSWVQAGFCKIKGITAEPNGDKIKVNYMNGDNNCHDCPNGESLSTVIFNLPYQIKQNDKNTYAFKCNMPSSYSITPHTNALGGEHDLLDNPKNLENDVFKMLNALNTNTLTIEKTFDFKGEINTKHPDKGVFANFKRILGQYSWDTKENITEVKKQNTFAFSVNGNDYPLFIEVFPYREGSKVVYSSVLKYALDSKGGSSLTKKDVENLQKRIEKITND